MLWDCHCHCDSIPLDRLDLWVDALQQQGFEGIFLGGVNPEEWQRQLTIRDRLNDKIKVKTSAGLHPWHIDSLNKSQFEDQLAELEKQIPGFDAIGELGLDYFRAKSKDDREFQQQAFQEQLAIARRSKKPLVIHCVRAEHDMLRLIKDFPENILMHSFTGSTQAARSFLDRGCLLSISPRSLLSCSDELLRMIPDEQILIETDAPISLSQKQCDKLSLDSSDSNAIVSLIAKLSRLRKQDSQNLTEQIRKNLENFLQAS